MIQTDQIRYVVNTRVRILETQTHFSKVQFLENNKTKCIRHENNGYISYPRREGDICWIDNRVLHLHQNRKSKHMKEIPQ